MIILMGDFNATFGYGKEGDIVGDHGLGIRNARGYRLIHYCSEKTAPIYMEGTQELTSHIIRSHISPLRRGTEIQ